MLLGYTYARTRVGSRSLDTNLLRVEQRPGARAVWSRHRTRWTTAHSGFLHMGCIIGRNSDQGVIPRLPSRACAGPGKS